MPPRGPPGWRSRRCPRCVRGARRRGRRASGAGFSVWYDPGVVVDQTIPADRLTREEIRTKSFKWGQGSATVWMKNSHNALGRLAKAAEFTVRTCYLWARSAGDPSFGKFFTYWYNRGYLSKLVEGLES